MKDKKISPHNIQTPDELLETAECVGRVAQQDFAHSAYLYYLARYMVAIYESRFDALPFQVWNEYRNALDHFMRYVSDPERETRGKRQLLKMEGHIQRAVLDCCKLFCHKSSKEIDNIIHTEGIDCLRLVDNGTFFREVMQKKSEANNNFSLAKTADSGLGKESEIDKEVIKAYIIPCFNYLDIINYFAIKRPEIENAASHLLEITINTSNEVRKEESGKLHLKSHLAGHAVWAVIALIVIIVWGKTLPMLIEMFPWLSVLG